ncbi:MAG: hypothetical protein JW951_01205 [Lentisphaerae bacterium]|nr:hypothetical protein [Lentisphaerota bacterium]
MEPFELEIVTPDGYVPPRPILALDVPAESGRLAVLARHAPLVCALTGGQALIMDATARRETWRLGPGTLTVTAGRATLLVRSATPPRAPAAPSVPPSPAP